MALEKKGMMFVLSSPSGVGKTTLTKKLAENNLNFKISISHTTRKPRKNEINGRDYHFVNEEEFNVIIKKNNFFEYAKIFENHYGTLKKPVIDLLGKGQDVLFDIDWQGTQQLKKNSDLSPVTFFILPPNIKTLRERLLNRHKGEEKLIKERMNKFNEEVSHWNEYNHVVINDNLNTCYENILKIIMSEKEGAKQETNLKEIKKKVEELIK
jgi:guanylate kinase|tara:strand:+ start:1634 stop:2266 length:633 start_codon:yes stop_codon:yes gene_type:complete